MKTEKNKIYEIQAFANESWRDVLSIDPNSKPTAVNLLKYKKATEKHLKWRLILRTVTEKKIA
jgi:hypothetical protein